MRDSCHDSNPEKASASERGSQDRVGAGLFILYSWICDVRFINPTCADFAFQEQRRAASHKRNRSEREGAEAEDTELDSGSDEEYKPPTDSEDDVSEGADAEDDFLALTLSEDPDSADPAFDLEAFLEDTPDQTVRGSV